MTDVVFKDHIIYDLESYPNIFTYCSCNSDGTNLKVFEISDRKNETKELLKELRRLVVQKKSLVGFNNIGFDYNLIHYIIEEAKKAKTKGVELKLSAKKLYNQTEKIINSYKGDGFGMKVREEEMVIPQIDLYLINHFDNKAKATSLKKLEVNMRSENVEDLPFAVGTNLDDEEKDILIKYNKHDVLQTLKFYNHCVDMIKLRYDLTEKYGFNCLNLNDSKIGGKFFMSKIEKENPNAFFIKDEYGKRKMRQTPRDKIVIKDCLFPYVKFSTPEFKALKEWFERQVITETNGVFSDIEEHLLYDLANYCEMVVKKVKFKTKPNELDVTEFMKVHPKGWVEEIELKAMETLKDADGNSIKEEYVDEKTGKVKARNVKVPKKSYYGCYRVAETLNVVYGGIRIDYGSGGLHAALQGHYQSTEDEVIMSYDVASMYPNIAIANNIYPEHLSRSFCKSYQDFYNERKKFAKGTAENLAIKLGLNCVYGNSNNKYSPFFDSKYTMSITINGQLTLSMLMEKVVEKFGAKLLMGNTDGAEFLINRKYIPDVEKLISKWEKYVGLQMEGVFYDHMYIDNVNNYISIYDNGEIKHKGQYVYSGLGWHQNHSALVVPMAVEHEVLGKGTAEDFIMNHKDPYDFLLSTKVPRSSRLVLVSECGLDIDLQNICRYYPSTTKGKLVKIMPPLEEGGEERRLGIMTEWDVKVCNNMKDFTWEINYDYYISEALKLLEPFGITREKCVN